MKVDHVFGGHVYVISSFGDARNPIFKDNEDLAFFTNNVKKYLGAICEIYAYGHSINQFHYLIKVNERPELEKFFFKKKGKNMRGKKNISHKIYDSEARLPPDSYLIFSQEVSNCLNSYAKKFNFRHKRKGGLFGDRYSKILVESEEAMNEWIERLNTMEELVVFEEEWRVEEEFEFENEQGECSSIVYYENEAGSVVHRLFNNFKVWIQGHLRGCFECLPPKSKNAPDFIKKYNYYTKIKGVAPPW